jgi:hypothetical protein
MKWIGLSQGSFYEHGDKFSGNVKARISLANWITVSRITNTLLYISSEFYNLISSSCGTL